MWPPGVCFVSGVSLQTNVSLIVATLDLQLVRLLRGAIRAADAASGHGGQYHGSPAATFEPRRIIHPEPRYERRPVIHPTPRFAPRPVERIHKTGLDPVPTCTVTCAPAPSHIGKSPIEPPWKKLPWENPAPPAQIIKVFVRRPDNACKGTIIDCFF